jgi:starch synthase (maltosyl-transferring)
VPIRTGSEEYMDSEKYEIKVRDWNAPGNLNDYIRRINQARRANPALHLHDNITFHETQDEHLLCYSKATADQSNVVIVVVNLDPSKAHEDLVLLDLEAIGCKPNEEFHVRDVLTDAVWTWKGARNYVRLDPNQEPAHLLIVQRTTPPEPAKAGT